MSGGHSEPWRDRAAARKVSRRDDETEGIKANEKVYRNNKFLINPSVSFADSSLYTREPDNFIKI